ncbi:MAG: hypothetical protein LBN30_04450 [Oscillospiraceae bacterium]|jgi:hypothetical protein|nr:hypothetical protein [Oscillospiraceae bacterium]
MTKNIEVVDEYGVSYGVTYPKRAKGLVKNGRARYENDTKIVLTEPPQNATGARPPNIDLEDKVMNISELDFSVAVNGRLDNIRIATVAQLVEFTAHELQRRGGFSNKNIQEIEQKLAQSGLSLKKSATTVTGVSSPNVDSVDKEVNAEGEDPFDTILRIFNAQPIVPVPPVPDIAVAPKAPAIEPKREPVLRREFSYELAERSYGIFTRSLAALAPSMNSPDNRPQVAQAMFENLFNLESKTDAQVSAFRSIVDLVATQHEGEEPAQNPDFWLLISMFHKLFG